MRETENERMRPAAVDRKITSAEVWKKRNAMSDMVISPAIPLISADFLKIMSITRMTRIGRSVSNRDMQRPP